MIYCAFSSVSPSNDGAIIRFLDKKLEDVFMGESIDESQFQHQCILRDGNATNFIYVCPGVMACDAYCYEEIRDFLKDCVQFIPIEINDINYYLMNVIDVRNALDDENSVKSYFPNGNLYKIDSHSFRSEMIFDAVIFKIPDTVILQFYVTDKFVDYIREKNLTGLRFVDPY